MLQRTAIDTTAITMIKEFKSPLANPPPVHALMKLSKYIPEGTVKPDTLVPGSLKAKKRIEIKGYNTMIDPNINIECAIIFSLFL